MTVRSTSSVNVSRPLPWCDAPDRRARSASCSAAGRPGRPRLEVAVAGVRCRRRRAAPVDVDQRRRDGHAAAHREAQPVRLARPVVRVLAEDRRGSSRTASGGGRRRPRRAAGTRRCARARRARRPAGRASTAWRTRRAGLGSSRSSSATHLRRSAGGEEVDAGKRVRDRDGRRRRPAYSRAGDHRRRRHRRQTCWPPSTTCPRIAARHAADAARAGPRAAWVAPGCG